MDRVLAQVPFMDLARQHEPIRPGLVAAFERVLDAGAFTLGTEVGGFEREFAEYAGSRHAVGVSSGTDALHLALLACGVEEGDEVILPANTFTATAEAILMCGARPVFVDIDESTYLMDLDAVEAAVSGSTSAIVPVHLYGQLVDMAAVRDLADRHGLVVVEDACQAHGASRDGMRAGTAGTAGCFSFYPSKNLGALGDGGMVITDDADVASRVRSLRNHGEDDDRAHWEAGFCSRLHGVQAAMLRVKLPHLDEWNALRIAAGEAYEEALAGTGIAAPSRAPGADHVYHLYVIRVPERDTVRRLLGERGVQSGIHYAVALTMEPAYASLEQQGSCPAAERAAGEIISLPMFPHLSTSEIETVASELAAVVDEVSSA